MENIIELNIKELALVSGGKKRGKKNKPVKKTRKLGKPNTEKLLDTKKSAQNQGLSTSTKYALAAAGGIASIIITGTLFRAVYHAYLKYDFS